MSQPPRPPRPSLSDPVTAGLAWAHYRRMMRWVALAAVVAILLAFVYLGFEGEAIPLHMIVATIAGVGGVVLLGGALMLLVFLSAGSGHDDDVAHGPDDGR